MTSPDLPTSLLDSTTITVFLTGWAAFAAVWIVAYTALAIMRRDNIVALNAVLTGGLLINFMAFVVMLMLDGSIR
jgi:hypothetical protein